MNLSATSRSRHTDDIVPRQPCAFFISRRTHMSSKNPSAPLSPVSSLRELEGLPDRQRRLLLRAGLGLSVGGSALLAACGGGGDSSSSEGTQGPTATTVSSFALAVLPDAQFYARYATTDENLQFQRKYGSTPYVAQTKWIADNAAELRIPFTIHLGDVVDQQGKPLQWQVADAAMKVLESAKMPLLHPGGQPRRQDCLLQGARAARRHRGIISTPSRGACRIGAHYFALPPFSDAGRALARSLRMRTLGTRARDT
jgi:hypothetical protein